MVSHPRTNPVFVTIILCSGIIAISYKERRCTVGGKNEEVGHLRTEQFLLGEGVATSYLVTYDKYLLSAYCVLGTHLGDRVDFARAVTTFYVVRVRGIKGSQLP